MPTMPASPLKTLAARLRKYALSFPEAYEEFPWGERVAKVNKKVFVFEAWIEESYRAIAPKKLVARLPA